MNTWLVHYFYSFSWGQFFLLALILVVLYFLLFGFVQLVRHTSYFSSLKKNLHVWSERFFVLYELFALLLLAGVFTLINPYLHGLILLVLVIGSWTQLRSYISGRWILFDRAIMEGVELKMGDLQGVIAKMGRIKMHLQTNEGIHHLSYNDLANQGYTLVSGEEIGGYYHLELSPSDALKAIKNHRLHLLDLFVMAPFVDWHHRPELFQDDDMPNTVDARVSIREESHLHELIALIKEWGYQCKVSDKY
ncbi:MAG: hypothetical protein AAF960_01080 [Bacteroidota bacterium]